MKNHRIVITGIGTINPLGKNVEEFYQNFLAGKSGIRRWESLDMSALECQIGGDMGDFDTKTAIEPFWQYFSGQKLKNLRKLVSLYDLLCSDSDLDFSSGVGRRRFVRSASTRFLQDKPAGCWAQF